ncbi:hypothetical protein ACWEPN_21155 [Nonomuraea wenchangensis]
MAGDGQALGLKPRQDGTFTFQDTPVFEAPPYVGEVSSAFVTVTVKREATLTLTGPRSGGAGTAVELSGVLTAGGRLPSPGSTLTVHRTLYVTGISGKTVKFPPVTVNADGTYSFTDTPANADH